MTDDYYIKKQNADIKQQHELQERRRKKRQLHTRESLARVRAEHEAAFNAPLISSESALKDEERAEIRKRVNTSGQRAWRTRGES